MSGGRWRRAIARAAAAALAATAALGPAAAPRAAAAQAAAPAVTVRVGQGSGASFAAAGTLAVPVIAEFAAGSTLRLGSLALRVTWDSARLALDGVDAGTAGAVFVGAAQAGERRLSFLDAAGLTTTFTVATLRFKAVAGTTGSTAVGVTVVSAASEAGTNVLPRVRVGTPYPVCASDATGDLLGDVTADGRVDVLDAQAVARFAVGLPVADEARVRRLGDVTGDGVADIVDAQQIARYAVGLAAPPRVGQATTGACVLLSYRVVLLSPASQTVNVGTAVEVRARVVDAGGTPVSDVAVTWEETGAAALAQRTNAAGEVATRRTPDRQGAVTGVVYLGGRGDGGPRATYGYLANALGADVDPFVLELQWVGAVPDPVRTAAEAAKASVERVVRVPAVRETLTNFRQVMQYCAPWIPAPYTGSIRGLVLYVTVTAIDGPGKTIAQAGPCIVTNETGMPAFATLEVDAADWAGFDPTVLRQVLLHEIMHAVGVGTVDRWDALVQHGTSPDPSFTGEAAFFGWQSARGVPRYAGAVPVESTGGQGTAGAHWRTSILADELMVGFVSRSSRLPLSIVTAGALRDLGYSVDLGAAEAYTVPALAAVDADPEPRVPLGESLRTPTGVLGGDGSVQPYRAGALRRPAARRLVPVP